MNLGNTLNTHIVLLLREISKDAARIAELTKKMADAEDVTRDEMEQIGNCYSRIGKEKTAVQSWLENCHDIAKQDKLHEASNG